MRRATEKDTYRLHSQADAVWKLIEKDSDCKCTEGWTELRDSNGDVMLDAQGRPIFVPLKACRTKLDHALRVARQASSYMRAAGEPSHGGSTPNPVFAALVSMMKRNGTWKPHITPEWWHERIMRDTALLNGALADLAVIVSELGKITATNPNDLGKNGQGTCPACDVFCSGAVNDRLKGGLCGTDYKAWERAGRPDRVAWIRERRAHYAQAS